MLLQRSASAEVAAAVRDAVARLRADAVPVPVYVCWVAPRAAEDAADLLREADVPVFAWPARTAEAVGVAVRCGQRMGSGAARALLAEAGIPVIRTVRCCSADTAAVAAERLGYPVVVKVDHPALAMLRSLRGAAVLDGVRGRAAVDAVAVADVIVRVSQVMAEHEAIAELDLNPVLADGTGYVAVDWLIRYAPHGAA